MNTIISDVFYDTLVEKQEHNRVSAKSFGEPMCKEVADFLDVVDPDNILMRTVDMFFCGKTEDAFNAFEDNQNL